MNFDQEFQEALKLAKRAKRNIATQEQLAAHFGFSPPYISLIFNGQRKSDRTLSILYDIVTYCLELKEAQKETSQEEARIRKERLESFRQLVA